MSTQQLTAVLCADRGPPTSQGTMTEGRLTKPAVVSVCVTVGSALGGLAPAASEVYAVLDAAQASALVLAGRAAADAAERYASSVRLQALAGQVQGLHSMRAALHAERKYLLMACCPSEAS